MKVAITGSTRGIGLSIATLLRDNNIEVLDINRSTLDLKTLEVDNISLTAVDVLINNAAIDTTDNILYKDFSYDYIVEMINVNLLAPMLLTNKFIKQNTKGTIINITSSCTSRPYTLGHTTYHTTKNGLSTFTKAIREELKSDNFRVIEIIPGRTDTDMSLDKHNSILPKDVAETVLFCINNTFIQEITVKHPKR